MSLSRTHPARTVLLHLAAHLLLAVCASPAGFAQAETKLAPESLGPGDRFGRAVALSADGRYAVVGAPEESAADTTVVDLRAGKAYVFERAGGGWLERAVLSASDPDSLAHFGRAVATSSDGSRIFVGAPYNGFGAVYVFARDGGGWTEEARLEVIDGCGSWFTCRFGWAVAPSAAGDVVVVGAPDDRVAGVRYGSLNVYRRTDGGWESVTKLGVNWGNYLGIAVALSADGRRAFGGTHRCCGSGQTGRVYVFDEADGAWAQTAVLAGSDGQPDNRFGNEVATTPDGEWLLVGAQGANDVGSSSGAAYVFEREGGGWVERQRLTASDAAARRLFGSSVALTADAGTLVIGAAGHDAGALGAGAAYVFVRSGNARSGAAWEEHVVFAPSDPNEHDYFGNTLALTPSGSHALFGVSAADAQGYSSGAAYVYDLPAVVPAEGSGAPLPAVRLSVYPNPSPGHPTLSIALPQPGPVEVVLLDVLGRAVRSVWDGSTDLDRVIPVDTSALPSGVYFLRVATPHGVSVERFVLQR